MADAKALIKDINSRRDAYAETFSDPATFKQKCKDVEAFKKEIKSKFDTFNTLERNARKRLIQDIEAKDRSYITGKVAGQDEPEVRKKKEIQSELEDASYKDLQAPAFSFNTIGGSREIKQNILKVAAESSSDAADTASSRITDLDRKGYFQDEDLKNCAEEIQKELDSLEDLYDEEASNIDPFFENDTSEKILSTDAPTDEEIEKAAKALASGDNAAAKKAVAKSDQSSQLALGNLSQQEIDDRARFEEQCFLVKHMKKLIKGSRRVKDLSSDKVISKADLSPDGFVNKLVHPEGYENIFNITPAQLSGLTPSVQIYKVFKGKDGESEIDVPIIMNTHTTADEINAFLQESNSIVGTLNKSRATGAGLKSMTLDFDGNNFFTAKRNIKSKLKLFFSSFEELLRVRQSTNGRTFSFIDLMMKTPSSDDKSRVANDRDGSPSNYRLKVVLGWGVAKGLISNFYNPDALNQTNLENSGITIQLIPVTHSINVGENGQVEVEIDYRAYIDAITASVYSNVLASKELYSTLFDYDKTLKEAKNQKCKSDDINAFKKEKAKEIDDQELSALKTIIDRLDTDKALNHAIIPKTAFSLGNSLEIDNSITILTEGTGLDKASETAKEKTKSDIKKAAEESSNSDEAPSVFVPINDKENKLINYFFLSDLIKIAIDQIEKSLDNNYEDIEIKKHLEQFKKIRVLLGPFVYYDNMTKGDTEKLVFSIGDIPISLNYFTEFFMAKTIKEGVSQYTLYQFLSDVINRLIAKIFSSTKCLANDRKNSLVVRNAVITSNVPALQKSGTPLPQTRNSNSSEEFTYLVYYASTRVPELNGIRSEDQKNGIYHFDIGANSGLVKTISFSKNDQKYVKEARFERDGVDGLGQLREAYDVSIQMYGNVQLYPGMYIFINPIGISPSLGNPTVKSNLSHLLGLGGYHLVTKVSSIVAEGQFDTTITAKWVSSGAERDGQGSDGGDVDNCGVEEVEGAANRQKESE